MGVARHFRLLSENHLDIAEGAHVVVEPAAGDRGPVGAAIPRLGIAPVDEAIIGKPRVKGHVEETALPSCDNLGHPGNGL